MGWTAELKSPSGGNLYEDLIDQSQVALAKGINDPLLWKAERGGKTTFLFGTFHFPPIKVPGPVLEKYVASSDCITKEWVRTTNGALFEEESTDEKTNATQDTYDYKKNLTEAQYSTLTRDLSHLKIDEINQMSFNSLIRRLHFSKASVFQYRVGISDSPSMDDLIEKEGLRLKKSMASLDSRKGMKALFSTLKSEIKPYGIRDVADFLDDDRASVRRTASQLLAYLSGDEKRTAESFIEVSPENNAAIRLFIRRDVDWVPIIEKRNSECTQQFVAIGIMHLLLDKDNVLEALKKDGFEIERLHSF